MSEFMEITDGDSPPKEYGLKTLIEREPWDKIVGMLLIPLYPITTITASKLGRHERSQWIPRVVLFLLMALLAFKFPENIDLLNVKNPFLLFFIYTPLLNTLQYVLIFIFQYHQLIKTEFESAAKQEVGEWLKNIVGHKMWSGQKTHDLLDNLVKDQERLGRSKWILINFLQQDIENKIRNTKNNDYKITVQEWDVYTYSIFLQKNIIYAKNNIYWLVDPIDFLMEILPDHIVEIMILWSSRLGDNDITRLSKLLKSNPSPDKDQRLSTILGEEMCKYCPYRGDGKCKWNNAVIKKCLEDCPVLIGIGEAHHPNNMKIIRTAMFRKSINTISETAKDIDLTKEEPLDFSPVAWTFDLPHLRAFRDAPVPVEKKKRSLYLGEKVGRDEFAKKWYEKYILDPQVDYFSSVQPCYLDKENHDKLPLEWHGWLSVSPSYKRRPGQKIDLQPFLTTPINHRAQRFIVEQALDLFAFMSGDKKSVTGCFVNLEKNDIDSHDMGIYDRGLMIYSGYNEDKRTITWEIVSDMRDRLHTIEESIRKTNDQATISQLNNERIEIEMQNPKFDILLKCFEENGSTDNQVDYDNLKSSITNALLGSEK